MGDFSHDEVIKPHTVCLPVAHTDYGRP